jgi:hypothetical protein
MNQDEIVSLTDCEDVLYVLSQHQLLIDSAIQRLDWMYMDCSEKTREELSDLGYFLNAYRDIEVREKLKSVIEAIGNAKSQSIYGKLENLFNQ